MNKNYSNISLTNEFTFRILCLTAKHSAENVNISISLRAKVYENVILPDSKGDTILSQTLIDKFKAQLAKKKIINLISLSLTHLAVINILILFEDFEANSLSISLTGENERDTEASKLMKITAIEFFKKISSMKVKNFDFLLDTVQLDKSMLDALMNFRPLSVQLNKLTILIFNERIAYQSGLNSLSVLDNLSKFKCLEFHFIENALVESLFKKITVTSFSNLTLRFAATDIKISQLAQLRWEGVETISFSKVNSLADLLPLFFLRINGKKIKKIEIEMPSGKYKKFEMKVILKFKQIFAYPLLTSHRKLYNIPKAMTSEELSFLIKHERLILL